jgi:hypothetical protein
MESAMRISRWIASSTTAVLFAIAAVATAVTPQDKLKFDDLPKAVKKTVNAKYPGATFRGILKEKNEDKETVYEVEMTVKGKNIDIIVDAEGDIDTIEEEIDADDLPKPVLATAKKSYPKGKITKAEKVTDEDKKVTYEVFIKVGDAEPKEVLMSPEGKIVTSAPKKEEDDEKEEKGKEKPKG